MNTLYKDINTPVRDFKYEELLELFWQSPYNFKVDLISKTRFIISVYPNKFKTNQIYMIFKVRDNEIEITDSGSYKIYDELKLKELLMLLKGF